MDNEMNISRVLNRLFMNYCLERVNETELRGWFYDGWDFLERLAKKNAST
jgi:hypothetical protein